MMIVLFCVILVALACAVFELYWREELRAIPLTIAGSTKKFSAKLIHKNKWLNKVNCSGQRTNRPPREYRGNNCLHFLSTKEEFRPLHPLRILMAFPLGKLSVKY